MIRAIANAPSRAERDAKQFAACAGPPPAALNFTSEALRNFTRPDVYKICHGESCTYTCESIWFTNRTQSAMGLLHESVDQLRRSGNASLVDKEYHSLHCRAKTRLCGAHCGHMKEGIGKSMSALPIPPCSSAAKPRRKFCSQSLKCSASLMVSCVS